jgi:hypothetical protein
MTGNQDLDNWVDFKELRFYFTFLNSKCKGLNIELSALENVFSGGGGPNDVYSRK